MPTKRTTERSEKGPFSNDYLLGSLLNGILTTLTDPKDGKAMVIKSDPAYFSNTKRTTERQAI